MLHRCTLPGVLAAWLTCHGGVVHAQSKPNAPTAPVRSAEGKKLDAYLLLLAQKKLAPPPAQSVEQLAEILGQAQEAIFLGRSAEAQVMLLEALESKRFEPFRDLPAYHTAELTLASLLYDAHALISAQRYCDDLLTRASVSPLFGPAYRREVDIALRRGDLDASATRLSALVKIALPEDAQSELHYLKALAAYDAGRDAEARAAFEAVGQKSRFYASAQYLLGALAARNKDFKEAEARFCKVTGGGKNDKYAFYVDGRYFAVRDQAQLGLGRVAHEQGRAEDAFYYYFQVPNDSERVSEALFEAAWASYEGEHHDAALDSLDQLEARYPRSAYAAEAGVLRGYVHLSRCEFGKAEQQLVKFERTFNAVLVEIDESLKSPARRQTLYRDLVAREHSIQRHAQRGELSQPDPDSLLLALVSADPEFYRLHAQIQSLRAELARGGRVADDFAALSVRVSGKDAPSARLDDAPAADAIAGLREGIRVANERVDAFSRELSRLHDAGADKAELAALSDVRKQLDQRVEQVSKQLDRALEAPQARVEPSAASDDLRSLLDQDQAHVRALTTRAEALRSKLEARANDQGVRALKALRERIAKELRRARIGRIDAVMGSKRRVELEVESLAAGRLPPELVDVVRMQSLLRDDEEYWPFEGEDWPDEFQERYVQEQGE